MPGAIFPFHLFFAYLAPAESCQPFWRLFMTPRLLLVLLFRLLCATLAFGQLQIPFHRFSLPNGLQVVLHEDHSVPVVASNIWYHVGSAREKPGRTGFAHLFEHLMFDGSAHVPFGKFDEWLEAVG